MHTDTVIAKPRTLSWSQQFWVSQMRTDIARYEGRLAGLEAAMAIDMMHGLTDAREIAAYAAMHEEHSRLLERLADAQDVLHQMLA